MRCADWRSRWKVELAWDFMHLPWIVVDLSLSLTEPHISKEAGTVDAAAANGRWKRRWSDAAACPRRSITGLLNDGRNTDRAIGSTGGTARKEMRQHTYF